jgi:hypothetical protein
MPLRGYIAWPIEQSKQPDYRFIRLRTILALYSPPEVPLKPTI